MGDSAHTTPHTNPGTKSAPPLFLEDENIFQKSAPLVALILLFLVIPTEPIFEKSSHLREKGGVLMLFKTTPHLGAKAQYSCTGQATKFSISTKKFSTRSTREGLLRKIVV
jgi:hypothetical protein